MNTDDRGSYAALQPIACAEPGAVPVAAVRGELVVVNKLARMGQFFDARDLELVHRTDSVDEAYGWITGQLREFAIEQPGAMLQMR